MAETKRPSLMQFRRNQQPEKPPEPRAESSVAVPVGKLKYRCGHEAQLTELEKRLCGPCKQEAAKAKQGRRKSRKEVKKSEAHAAEMAQANNDSRRLPNGALFHVVYDAEKKEWSGSLTIQSLPVLENRAGGLFRLLGILDGMYRGVTS